MKKKTMVFSCLAVLFLLSAFSGFSSGLVSGGVGCLVICGIFVFLAFRSAKSVTETNSEMPQTPNRFTTPNENSFSQSLHDNTVNTDTAKTLAAAPVPSTPVPPVFAEERETAVIQPPTVSDAPNAPKPFEYLEIKVAGVTFKNDKGPTRQNLLKKIKERSAPFDEYLEISINQYDFEGELAYSVCVNDRQIGNVPKSQVQYLHDNIERFVAITGINVYGGYRDENGYFKSYGAAITVKFRLSDNNS